MMAQRKIACIATIVAFAIADAAVPPPLKCSDVFSSCPANEADPCFLYYTEDASKYPTCNQQLSDIAKDFNATRDALFGKDGKKRWQMGDAVAHNKYIIGGVTGTCLTLLRYINITTHSTYGHSNACPYPEPPTMPVLDRSTEDVIPLFTLGDWGPTPTYGGCPCPHFPDNKCHWSMFGHLWRARNACNEGIRENHNDAQQTVADQMGKFATIERPTAVINVGDNFYLGGLSTPANIMRGQERGVSHDYACNQSFQQVYLKNKNANGKLQVPWLGMLGNHDYGGSGCLADWQQQIEFTKTDQFGSWKIPFQFYHQRIRAKDYFVDIFVNDANYGDIDAPGDRGICHQVRCAGGFRESTQDCETRMHNTWKANWAWLQRITEQSKQEGARWTIFAGHFNAGWDVDTILNRGKDLFEGSAVYVCGHSHTQSFSYKPPTPVMVTGAGGGYMMEGENDYYGFGIINIAKDDMTIRHIDNHGKQRFKTIIAHPQKSQQALTV